MKRLTYIAPKARDLSALSVQGSVDYLCNMGLIATPEGCTSGAQPDGTCGTGMFVSAPAPCTAGGAPDSGECVTGGTAAAGSLCTSGNAV
jgi:hypothetical protein